MFRLCEIPSVGHRGGGSWSGAFCLHMTHRPTASSAAVLIPSPTWDEGGVSHIMKVFNPDFHYIIWIIVHPRLTYINPVFHFVFLYEEAAADPRATF